MKDIIRCVTTKSDCYRKTGGREKELGKGVDGKVHFRVDIKEGWEGEKSAQDLRMHDMIILLRILIRIQKVKRAVMINVKRLWSWYREDALTKSLVIVVKDTVPQVKEMIGSINWAHKSCK